MYTGMHQCFCQMVARYYIKFYRIYKGLLVVVSVNYLVNWQNFQLNNNPASAILFGIAQA